MRSIFGKLFAVGFAQPAAKRENARLLFCLIISGLVSGVSTFVGLKNAQGGNRAVVGYCGSFQECPLCGDMLDGTCCLFYEGDNYTCAAASSGSCSNNYDYARCPGSNYGGPCVLTGPNMGCQGDLIGAGNDCNVQQNYNICGTSG